LNGVDHSLLAEDDLDPAKPENHIIGSAHLQLAGAHSEVVSNDAAPAHLL